MALGSELDAHVRRIITIHFDPRTGAPYWLERQQTLGIDALARIHTFADLERLGPMEEVALARRQLFDFVPLSRRQHLQGAIVTDTGGTTGSPKRTVFSRDEFHAGFVEPFVRMAQRVGFPRGGAWLFVGPGGPHIIGQAAAACAVEMGGHQPFTVDFDPRWFRKLPAGSMGRDRYVRHLLDQAADVLNSEPIDVLFTTPPMVQGLAEIMADSQRERIRGVHYGGMRVESALLLAAQTEWFPRAVHLAGYGNSLFGVCMERGGDPSRSLHYFPHGLRHQVRVARDGRVWMHRLDPSVLIANLAERDAGRPTSPEPELGRLGFGLGVEDPSPIHEAKSTTSGGIY